ncbi:histone-lysine N-methyltransferase EHMT2 isoform X2 [Homalodisca vitripennis]|uniref:histone-lysine N-methyltransferase EHMT2 isoform X2 n=1 Tax=Homalodisca vitripennis TaxID=197043 RepID=UPI001EEBA656|nr:histone-lysine N-methyltransferase EHMT2 isoform X2 [Homalodisca vitripennis]
MTSNILDENDLDFDASVSSFNSDSEKVDSSLIKRILSEMKSEFNRGACDNPEEADNENDTENCKEELKMDNLHVKEEGNEVLATEPANEDNDLSSVENVIENVDENCKNTPIIVNKTVFHAEEDGDEQKPRLILTLRTSEEDREMGNRLSRRISICQSTSDTANTSFSSVSDSSGIEKTDYEGKGSMWETVSRRSLRSSSRLVDRDNENTGMKRSSRRFSKEHCRESVLQSAIARKEKSFSSLNQFEERSSRRGARSPRQSSNEPKINKPVTRSKSPKNTALDKSLTPDSISSEVVLKQGDLCDTNTLLSNTESDYSVSLAKIENDDLSNDSNDTVNINSASTNSQTSEPSMDIKPLKTNKMYTKTGKRRTKYYRGLKYSLTTGGSVVRKRTLNVGRRTKKKNQEDPVISVTINSEDINPKNVVNAHNKNDNLISDGTAGLDEKSNNEKTIKNESKEAEYQESIKTELVTKVKEESWSENENPAVADGCQAVINKRKLEPDIEESDAEEKRRRVDVPSPCQGDVEAEPNKPEATAISIGVGTAGVCLCNRREKIYAKTTSYRTELYCQAVDSLDGRLIGCCNTVSKDDARLLRPSARVPFLVLCDVHYDRLQRHNCCPGCGIFCTQGKFVQCWAYHQYHRECQLEVEGRQVCPHCGSDDAYDVNISLGAHKYPVFFPLQKPTKKTPSAKMTFTYKADQSEDDKMKEIDQNGPLVPATSLVLPSGLQISSMGLPAPLDKDKFTLRNMYQAAKSGETEKIVHMLAAGLNPNHVFREWGMGSALHAACHNGHLAVVHLLLQAGANTDVLDRDQNTPLMLACANGHNEIVKYLVKAGASVTFKGGDGMTALHLAAKSGNIEACHYLIANPNTPRNFIDSVDDGRWTPLVWAAEHKHIDVVKFLLQKRADPLVRDAEQNIALHWAALSGCIDISEALLNYGSDVNSTNAHADTPLHIAARQNAYECVILLLARGARVDMHNRAGFMPLDCVTGAPNDTYTAIKLNVELRNLTLNVQKRTHKILTNDITRGYEANPVQCINSVDDETEPQDFVYVTENCFTSNINIDRTITSLQSCKCRDMCVSGGCMCGKISIRCWYDDEGKLLPEFNFADPPMLFECNQACSCNRLTCKNRVVQHGITARFQLFRTKGNKGWGVRTLRLIPKGTYVCEYIGEIISDCEADTREDDSYLFDLDNRDGETYCIDARRYGNIARFINHSCMPNLLPVRVFIDHQDLHFPRIAFFANQDIQASEELGFDYGEKFWTIKSKLFKCTCGAEQCKYSETTIEKTLAAYNKKLEQEENHEL